MDDKWIEKRVLEFINEDNEYQKKKILKQVYERGGKTQLLKFAAISGVNIKKLEYILFYSEPPKKPIKQKKHESFNSMVSKDIYHTRHGRTRKNGLSTHIKDFK